MAVLHLSTPLDSLGITRTVVEATSPAEEANKWFSAFVEAIRMSDIASIIDLFHETGSWRDIVALTWSLRTLRGRKDIKRLLDARFEATGLTTLQLNKGARYAPARVAPLPDLAFIRFCFTFETLHGKGSGVCHLVRSSPSLEESWKAHALLTHLDTLKVFPVQAGVFRSRMMFRGSWEEKRNHELEFSNGDPDVLIIGAGQCGLQVAAHLKYMGVSTLVIERNARVGDNWRARYKSLFLHNLIHYNQTSYLRFPSTWPLFSPAPKLGDWFEGYARFLDLNVWTSSSIMETVWDETAKSWNVVIDRGGTLRRLKIKHVVLASGPGGSIPRTPDIPGQDCYHGRVVHSSEYKTGSGYEGMKAIVVGACNSAHDIALDLCNNDTDVTIIQRSSTFVVSHQALAAQHGVTYNDGFPTELADLLGLALPWSTQKSILQCKVPQVAGTTDRALLEGLERIGFKTNLGPDGTGVTTLSSVRGGGFYINTGASEKIIDGSIKLKSGCSIERFTTNGLALDDGTELQADIVIFATGFGDLRDSVRLVCGEEVAKKVGLMWGMDDEGELRSVWKDSGHEGLWIAAGNLSRARIHSMHLALQIKASLEGLFRREELTF
ncbi:FAD/NAD(P)-binding domain-containing protein [Rhizopogon vinicolor AM-OR11-026]|uniref:FAD/NAD(P)-binding domain-containing protein n=1 Tax=Rhizopogon vinicolor AM-OR11-026 TaxID=1314800 RepID=A0A1B7NBS0_9AGAM|nr:FAD/NAD(P)-binding domain-containing protein [Rhizopogon vinicolor AM-OR11-026]